MAEEGARIEAQVAVRTEALLGAHPERHVSGRRFKTRGMSWFRRGVSHLLHLKLLRLNGTWDRYWAGRLAEARRPSPTAA